MALQLSISKALFLAAQLISKSKLFDGHYYCEENNLNLGFTDPIWHYVTVGYKKNYQANEDQQKQMALDSILLSHILSPINVETGSKDLYIDYKNYLLTDINSYCTTKLGKKLFSKIASLRIDMKLFSNSAEKLDLHFTNNENIKIEKPKWMNENKNVGYKIETTEFVFSFTFSSISDCTLKFYLMGQDLKDVSNSRILLFLNDIDFVICDQNEKSLIEELNIKNVSYDRKKILALDVKSNVNYTAHVSYLPNIPKKEELLNILYKKQISQEEVLNF